MRRIFLPLAAAGLLLGSAGVGGAGSGARVRSVRADSPAARAGIQPGDEILVAGGRDVRDEEELAAALELPGRKTVAVRRNGAIRILMLRA